MGYQLQAHLVARIDAVEIADDTTSPGSGDGGDRRTYDQYGVDVNLHGEATSFPEVGNQVADISHTLVGTTKDFDLTAVPWAGDISKNVDFTGKKLVGIEVRFSKANNAAGVSLGGNGANAYGLFGTTIKPVFFPGAVLVMGICDPLQAAAFTNNLPAVAAGAKDIRFTGAVADAWVAKLIFSE